jgi:rare lipoprotein A
MPSPFLVLRTLAALFALGLASGCATTTKKSRASSPGQPFVQRGTASWYGEAYRGKPTASGEPFNPDALTAAHRTLPFGTRIRVINLRNSRAAVLRINDRGPTIPGRVLDVSERAARDLGMVREGLAPVELRTVPRNR